MRYGETTKISSKAFKNLYLGDMLLGSFTKDETIFPMPVRNGKYIRGSVLSETISKINAFKKNLNYCPHFAISSGDVKTRRFEYEGKFMEFIPGSHGLPTVRDFDILLYCMSWIGNAFDNGRCEGVEDWAVDDVSNCMEFEVEDFYNLTSRGRGPGRDATFVEALERLSTSHITTDTRALEHTPKDKLVPYLIEYKLTRDDGGRIKTVWVQIPKRLCLLTEHGLSAQFDREFFELSPIRRAIYICVTTLCDRQTEYTIAMSFSKLHQLVGTPVTLNKFTEVILEIEKNQIPSFHATIDFKRETITFKCTRPLPDAASELLRRNRIAGRLE